MQRLSSQSGTIIEMCNNVWNGGPKYKGYIYLDEFWYSGAYEITFYESREVEIQIQIHNS